MTIFAATADAVADAVRDAGASNRTLEIVGTGTRRGYGRPVEADDVLDVSGLSGIVDYDPAELVLTARPGTPVAEIAALVAAHGQHLAFDPPDLAPLWGGAPGAGTLGGALALGLGGSRRISAGAPRDHFLGFAAVNGLGEKFSAGGKVIKNVTGYDLPKLMAGSLGTLAVYTEVTIKVLPAPRMTATVISTIVETSAAVAAMTAALRSPAAIDGSAHLRHPVRGGGEHGSPTTGIRIAGVPVAVRAHAAALVDLLRDFGDATVVDDADWWDAVGSVYRFADPGKIVWRVSLPPSRAAAFIAAIDPACEPRWYLDWGGGLVWLFLADAHDGHALMVRHALSVSAGYDGHATLVRAPDATRARIAPFQPLAPALAALNERVRARFDPGGVLNPGRIVPKDLK